MSTETSNQSTPPAHTAPILRDELDTPSQSAPPERTMNPG